MMLYRSLVLGLLGALILLVARHPARPAPGASEPTGPRATIVDISHDALVAGADVQPALGLAPGERVVAIDDQPVRDRAAVGSAIESAEHGRFVDLDVRRAGTTRRVLVLVH